MYRRDLSIVAFSILLASVGADDKAPPMPKKGGPSEIEQKVIDQTNAERKKAELPALKPNATLMKAARSHSENMAKQDMLAHELDGKGPDARLDDLGYKHLAVAENCAAGQRTPEEVVASWMESEPHKANILGEKYTEVGVGLAKTADGKIYWTLLFAAPRK